MLPITKRYGIEQMKISFSTNLFVFFFGHCIGPAEDEQINSPPSLSCGIRSLLGMRRLLHVRDLFVFTLRLGVTGYKYTEVLWGIVGSYKSENCLKAAED